ncbi:MAG: tetratricopeptide repeat protein [Deltaproteobacteria bacterium]|nr:tetratricopeptide repeat protein [Deltaproteobacteria bacterium]
MMRPALRALLIAAVAGAIYFPSVAGGPITDDHTFVFSSARLTTPDGLRAIWMSLEGEDYWPLSYSVFWAVFQLFGGAPPVFHLINLILHVACAMVLGAIVRVRTIERPADFVDAGLAASLLFVTHPVAVESVAWIIQLKTVMSTFFAFLCVWAWGRRDRRFGVVVALGFHVLSLLAKSSTVTVPFVLLAMTWADRPLTRRDMLQVAPFFAVSLVLGALGLWAHRTHFAAGEAGFLGLGALGRVALAGQALWFYVQKAVVPVSLSFVVPKFSLLPLRASDFVATAAMIGGLVIIARLAPRAVVAGVLAYVALLVPALGVVDIPYMQFSYVADHWQYAGLGVVATMGALGLVRAGREAGRVAAALLLVLLAIGARDRAVLYTSEILLLEDAAAKNPGSGPLLAALGQARMNAGEVDGAREAYQRAVSVEPTYPHGHSGLANVLAMMGRTREAEASLLEAYRLAPNDASIAYDLGSFFASTGRLDAAIEQLERSLELDPSRVDTHLNLGNARAMKGDLDGARAELNAAMKLDPAHPGPRTNLGLLALRSGDLDGARAMLESVRESAPSLLPARLGLAEVYLRTNQPARARAELEAAKSFVAPGSEEAKMIEAAILRTNPKGP